MSKKKCTCPRKNNGKCARKSKNIKKKYYKKRNYRGN